MKKIFMMAALLMMTIAASAQTNDDPVIMTINNQPVKKSEFEYSYKKNNSEGVIDKKTVKEYVDLFINYKLKVEAAKDAKVDTMASFKKEFAKYRDQQIRPAMITDDDVEAEAKRIYKEAQTRIDSMGGLVKPAHILLLVKQKDTDAEAAAAKQKIDSLYNVLKAANFNEALFSELAQKYSQDAGTAKKGGELPWIQRGQTMKEFDDKVFAMKKGETSEPLKTMAGWHIIQLRDKGDFFPYDSLRNNIYRFIDQRNIRDKIVDQRLDTLAKQQGITPQQVLDNKREEMVSKDQDLAYLIQEYHDGLMLYEIENQLVWDKASKDDKGLEKFFKKNKKKYQWDSPRFKGIAYHTRNIDDVQAVKDCVNGVPFAEWNDKLRSTFNNDSVLRIRAEKGIFKKGDNGLVDRDVFGVKDAKVKKVKDYPNDATCGKIINAPEDYLDVKALVVTDYQDALEKEWVNSLRKKYTFTVNEDVLNTVK